MCLPGWWSCPGCNWAILKSASARGRAIGQSKRDLDDLFSTDAWGPYSPTIARYFGNRATYAQIVKFYAAENPGPGRYAPPHVSGTEITEVLAIPNYNKVRTSYVERQNLRLRMKIARFHRLSLAFSRKLMNLKAAVALYFWTYNFCLIHRSLRMTPAMAAGITDRIWELKELIS